MIELKVRNSIQWIYSFGGENVLMELHFYLPIQELPKWDSDYVFHINESLEHVLIRLILMRDE